MLRQVIIKISMPIKFIRCAEMLAAKFVDVMISALRLQLISQRLKKPQPQILAQIWIATTVNVWVLLEALTVHAIILSVEPSVSGTPTLATTTMPAKLTLNQSARMAQTVPLLVPKFTVFVAILSTENSVKTTRLPQPMLPQLML
jgi:hypothetical protein